VRADSPWLVELGRALAVALSTPSHELRVRTLPTADFAHARTTHAFSLALDICRPYDATPLGVYVALVTSDDPARGAQLAKHPPLGPAAGSPRVVSRLLHLGVVCDVPFQGGRAPDLDMPPGPGGSGVDFGSITRPHPSVP
jgi:hypothetical protein